MAPIRTPPGTRSKTKTTTENSNNLSDANVEYENQDASVPNHSSSIPSNNTNLNEERSFYQDIINELRSLREASDLRQAAFEKYVSDQNQRNNPLDPIEEFRLENERLRREINRLNGETQTRTNSNNRSLSMEDPNRINSLHSIRSVNIDIPIPKFDANIDENAVEFLEDFEKYCVIKQIDEKMQLFLIGDRLGGRARHWFQSRAFASMNNFKTQFLVHFYSDTVKANNQTTWLSRKYTNHLDASFQNYFYDQIKKARHFDPPFKKTTLHIHIIQQLPLYIREKMTAVDYTDEDALAQILYNFDLLNRERIETDRRKNNTNSLVNNRSHESQFNNRAQGTQIRKMSLKNGHAHGHCNTNGPSNARHGDCRSASLGCPNGSSVIRGVLSPDSGMAHDSRDCCQMTHSNYTGRVNSGFDYRANNQPSITLPDTRIPPPTFMHKQISSQQAGDLN